MYGAHYTDRRTVLKTIPATVAGGSVVTGAAGASHEGAGGTSSTASELEIVAEHDHDEDEHRFELSTDEVSAGWTTVTFDNRTDHTHFVYLARIPEAAIAGAEEDGEDLRDYWYEHLTRPFQFFMDDIDPEKEPDPDDLSDKYSDPDEGVLFPPWFEDALPSGGVGLTSGGMTSTTTVELAPGEYQAECYVKNEDGEFHSYDGSDPGMLQLFTVSEERGGSEPDATLDLSLSSDGIDVDEDLEAGQHTVAVQIEDQQIYDHGAGHDVHLIRFDAETTVDDVNGWTNWADPAQFVSDGTEPGTFLGGVQTILTPELLEGAHSRTAYVDVTLNPGAYAWVSEVPDPADHGLLEPFIVPFDESGE